MSFSIAVVGLGYVGLPLAVEFGKKFETIGFDLSEAKITHYKNYCDPTGEVSSENLRAATHLTVSTDPSSIAKADFIIVAVPTPVNDAHIFKWTAAMINNEPVWSNGDGETSRDFCCIANTIQANLLAATAESPDAANQVYNMAVGDRTTLNDLFESTRATLEPRFLHLKGYKPSYHDFRASDVRHSLADIGKARTLLGYEPSHRIKEGLVEAMDWYVSNLSPTLHH